MDCEGTVTYTYTYTDCEGNSHDWVYTYTIEVEDFAGNMPADAGRTVSCIAAAVDPGAPADITDGCGRTVSAVLVGSVETPNPVTCEGKIGRA